MAATAERPTRTLSLTKGEHRFFIRYELGDEAGVDEALIEMAQRPDLPFGYFDAAVLSHQLKHPPIHGVTQ